MAWKEERGEILVCGGGYDHGEENEEEIICHPGTVITHSLGAPTISRIIPA